MMNLVRDVLLMVAIAALVAGCAPLATVLGSGDPRGRGNGQAAIELDGTRWDLVEIGGETVSEASPATLDFAAGQVTGRAFCNRFFGPYEQEGSDLSFGMLGSTMMACPELDRETAYLQALSTVTAYRMADGNLVLVDESGADVLAFSPAAPAALEGTRWLLTGYNTGNAISSLILETEISAEFEDGKVRGSAGCNTYFGDYTVDDTKLTFGPIAMTEMFCMEPEGLMDQETDYLRLLGSVTSYAIDRARERDTLTLRDADGTQLLAFIAEQ